MSEFLKLEFIKVSFDFFLMVLGINHFLWVWALISWAIHSSISILLKPGNRLHSYANFGGCQHTCPSWVISHVWFLSTERFPLIYILLTKWKIVWLPCYFSLDGQTNHNRTKLIVGRLVI
jgi:hypothetical protein